MPHPKQPSSFMKTCARIERDNDGFYMVGAELIADLVSTYEFSALTPENVDESVARFKAHFHEVTANARKIARMYPALVVPEKAGAHV